MAARSLEGIPSRYRAFSSAMSAGGAKCANCETGGRAGGGADGGGESSGGSGGDRGGSVGGLCGWQSRHGGGGREGAGEGLVGDGGSIGTGGECGDGKDGGGKALVVTGLCVLGVIIGVVYVALPEAASGPPALQQSWSAWLRSFGSWLATFVGRFALGAAASVLARQNLLEPCLHGLIVDDGDSDGEQPSTPRRTGTRVEPSETFEKQAFDDDIAKAVSAAGKGASGNPRSGANRGRLPADD